MFKKIVVAVDGSENSDRAVGYAAGLAGISNAMVTIVHAYEPVPAWLGKPNSSDQIGWQISRGEEIVTEAEKQLREKGVTEIEQNVLEGPAASAIVRAAAVREADLIVVGSRGLTRLEGLLLGSVSERVIGAARCPVLVVH